jgi:hypothetical protein
MDLNSKLVWLKPKDEGPAVEVVDEKLAILLQSVNEGIASAAKADRELKRNIADEYR